MFLFGVLPLYVVTWADLNLYSNTHLGYDHYDNPVDDYWGRLLRLSKIILEATNEFQLHPYLPSSIYQGRSDVRGFPLVDHQIRWIMEQSRAFRSGFLLQERKNVTYIHIASAPGCRIYSVKMKQLVAELSDDLLNELLSQFLRPDDLGFVEFLIANKLHLIINNQQIMNDFILTNTSLTF